jgi:hypothetical protein
MSKNLSFGVGLKSPTLIIKYGTGITYSNQTNGCACSYKEIEGFIIPISLSHECFFNPRFWYDEYGFCNRNIHKIFYNVKWDDRKTTLITLSDLDEALRIGAANCIESDIRGWHLWQEFCEFLEEELEYLELKVRQDIPSQEAWVNINTKYGEGIISWENCD